MPDLVVMKFGGTSVKDAEAMRRVASIVSNNSDRRTIVVTSALSGITNNLLLISEALARDRKDEAHELYGVIAERHRTMLSEFGEAGAEVHSSMSEMIEARLAELRALIDETPAETAIRARSRDAVVSFGEYLSSPLLTLALVEAGVPAVWFDVKQVMHTDGVHQQAHPDVPAVDAAARDRLRPVVEEGLIPVTQGFIGRGPDGATTTLGRGGSDYSAALIGAALSAVRIEVWTDVSGVMTADPRIVPNARKIRHLSFAEAAELAYFGAKVLHPATLLPAVRSNIPVAVLNTMKPEDEGTTITRKIENDSDKTVRSIACKRDITVINITSARMLMAHGFLRRVFAIFDEYETPVDLVSTSEVSVSVTIDKTERLDDIVRWLQEIGTVDVHEDHAIVCAVGSRMSFTPGIAARIFAAVPPANVRLVSQGASELNLSFVVEQRELDDVVRRLHEAFFE